MGVALAPPVISNVFHTVRQYVGPDRLLLPGHREMQSRPLWQYFWCAVTKEWDGRTKEPATVNGFSAEPMARYRANLQASSSQKATRSGRLRKPC